MSDSLTTEELIERVRETRARAEAVAEDLRFLVAQLRKQISDDEGDADDRQHA